MSLDILEFTVENEKNGLGKTVLKMWWICEKIAYVSTKLLLEKCIKTTTIKKKHESVHNLWRILGTKIVLFVGPTQNDGAA